MAELRNAPREYPHELVKLHSDTAELDFVTAKTLAKSKALEINPDAMMLSYYDDRKAEGFPNYDCGSRSKPPWEVFAESRGCNLIIDVDDGDYLFFYLKL
ncbi:MAG: AF1514 family protein [Desulfosarcinaceae bacterium]|nr:AF1514 family protein [Desulfosarcinaceae bacterium]